MNELGALRLQSIVRHAVTALSTLHPGAGSVRAHFSRLNQLLSLWTVERLAPDVAELRFPRPVLPVSDVAAALRCRVDFAPAAVDAVVGAPERLRCCVPPAPPPPPAVS